MDGISSQLLYEVEKSAYLSEVMATGMKALYVTSLNVKHYSVNTAKHIIDILTSETYGSSDISSDTAIM